MVKIVISGCCGKMGKAVAEAIKLNGNLEVAAGVDISTGNCGFPVFNNFESINVDFDVIIDFSHPSVLPDMLKYSVSNKKPCVIATTGFNNMDIENIKAAAKVIPIFFTFNMSLGVNLLIELSKKAASVLGSDFDIEIIEKHHNRKIDAPSGTAIMLADAINSVYENKYHYEYDRHLKHEKRQHDEIGIHSVRAGTIVGEHQVIFCGHDEEITITHSAFSREIFAVGAVNAALFLSKCDPGLYDMSSYLAYKS